jgi:catechol 2,3-dioxygenase-like lactoylglutathione lyase family enzyme
LLACCILLLLHKDFLLEARVLNESKMVGFLFTKDYDKANAFFVGKLGFTFLSFDQFALAMRCGENMVRVSRLADFTLAQGTVLGWEVADIQAAVAWLKQRGITPEKYPFMQGPDEFWTAPSGDKVAWFKDPDGNILSVSQHV